MVVVNLDLDLLYGLRLLSMFDLVDGVSVVVLGLVETNLFLKLPKFNIFFTNYRKFVSVGHFHIQFYDITNRSLLIRFFSLGSFNWSILFVQYHLKIMSNNIMIDDLEIVDHEMSSE